MAAALKLSAAIGGAAWEIVVRLRLNSQALGGRPWACGNSNGPRHFACEAECQYLWWRDKLVPYAYLIENQ
jgi:hypothetical protein